MDIPRYLKKPNWSQGDMKVGGTRMTVVLGPAACDSTNYGSRPSPGTPKVMVALIKKYPKFNWKAGHLLNDNMGGPGDYYNLTPLTGTANRNHSTYEGRIKNAVIQANQRARFNPGEIYWYGVEYTVVVSKVKHAAKPPLGAVAINMQVKAKPVKQLKTGGPIEDVVPADNVSMTRIDRKVVNKLA